ASGGTEGNALALAPGMRRGEGAAVERLVVSAIEHTSVLAGGRFPEAAVTTVGVTANGLVDLVQAFGKIALDIKETGADLLSLSAHKIGGPKGVGALVLAEGISAPAALLRGGGQEKGRRAGTENVTAIAGFAAAASAALPALKNEAHRLEGLRNRLEGGLHQTPGAIVFSQAVPRLPNTSLFTVPGLRAETAVIGFDLAGIAVSSGSACSSGKVQPSHVLEAMGFGSEVARGAVRLSLGWSTRDADIDSCLEAWRKLAPSLLKDQRRNTA